MVYVLPLTLTSLIVASASHLRVNIRPQLTTYVYLGQVEI
jgi:hypothetical protein